MRKNFLEVEVTIPRDASGLVALRCDTCGNRFAVQSLAEELWCPACGQRAPLLRLFPLDVKTRVIHELRLLVWEKDKSS